MLQVLSEQIGCELGVKPTTALRAGNTTHGSDQSVVVVHSDMEATVLLYLLLRAGDVERNPGPSEIRVMLMHVYCRCMF